MALFVHFSAPRVSTDRFRLSALAQTNFEAGLGYMFLVIRHS